MCVNGDEDEDDRKSADASVALDESDGAAAAAVAAAWEANESELCECECEQQSLQMYPLAWECDFDTLAFPLTDEEAWSQRPVAETQQRFYQVVIKHQVSQLINKKPMLSIGVVSKM